MHTQPTHKHQCEKARVISCTVRWGQRQTCIIEPLLQQRLEFAHVFKAQIQGLKARNSSLAKVVSIQLPHGQANIPLWEGEIYLWVIYSGILHEQRSEYDLNMKTAMCLQFKEMPTSASQNITELMVIDWLSAHTCVKPSLIRLCLKVLANCSSSSRSLGSSRVGVSNRLGGVWLWGRDWIGVVAVVRVGVAGWKDEKYSKCDCFVGLKRVKE